MSDKSEIIVPEMEKAPFATCLMVDHEIHQTTSTVVFSNGVLVHFDEDNILLQIAHRTEEYVEGVRPYVDKYVAQNSDPQLLWDLPHVKMRKEEAERINLLLKGY
jgi:hypothetical protein